MRGEWLLSLAAVTLAFLGSQLHNLMMLLFAFGLGNVGVNLMTEMPLLRAVMLATYLLMAAMIAYQISRPKRPLTMRITGALSIASPLASWVGPFCALACNVILPWKSPFRRTQFGRGVRAPGEPGRACRRLAEGAALKTR